MFQDVVYRHFFAFAKMVFYEISIIVFDSMNKAGYLGYIIDDMKRQLVFDISSLSTYLKFFQPLTASISQRKFHRRISQIILADITCFLCPFL